MVCVIAYWCISMVAVADGTGSGRLAEQEVVTDVSDQDTVGDGQLSRWTLAGTTAVPVDLSPFLRSTPGQQSPGHDALGTRRKLGLQVSHVELLLSFLFVGHLVFCWFPTVFPASSQRAPLEGFEMNSLSSGVMTEWYWSATSPESSQVPRKAMRSTSSAFLVR